MKRKLSLVLLFSVAIAISALYYTAKVGATPASGFSGTTLAKGTFGDIEVFNHYVLAKTGGDEHRLGRDHKRNVWLSSQRTKGSSDLYVQSNVWQPGGSTGWHTHPGHSLIIVTAGTVTAYDGDDPNCQPTEYKAGMGFVDPGGDHIHNLRNEGTVAASTIAVQLIPEKADRRIDAPDPGNCHF
jgi:quercetin dioxygenase-like cupin family protein